MEAYSNYFGGRGGDFQQSGHHSPIWSLMVGLRTIVVLADVLQREHTEAQGLLEVDLSATLDLFGSSQFILCPCIMSFF